MQALRPAHYPLRKPGSPARRLAQRDGPVIEPACAFLSHVGVGQSVRRIAQSVAQRDEMVASFAHDIEEVADVVGLELIAVEQQDLFWLVADGLFGKLFRIGKYLVAVAEIAARDFVRESCVSAFPGIVVDPGIHPVPGIKRYRSDPVASGNEEGFSLAPRLKVTACIQKGMAEVSEFHAVFGQQQAGYALALHNVVFPNLQSNLVE